MALGPIRFEGRHPTTLSLELNEKAPEPHQLMWREFRVQTRMQAFEPVYCGMVIRP